MTCEWCGVEAQWDVGRMKKQRFCSNSCAQKARWAKPRPVTRAVAESALAKYVVRTPNGCWGWSGHTSRGYGIVSLCGKAWLAHRASYFVAHGEVPAGMEIRHVCNTKQCTNPEHLVAGTHAENMADQAALWRSAPGPKRPRLAKLTDEQALEIYRLARSGAVSQTVLGRRYGVHQSIVSQIASKKRWLHIHVRAH